MTKSVFWRPLACAAALALSATLGACAPIPTVNYAGSHPPPAGQQGLAGFFSTQPSGTEPAVYPYVRQIARTRPLAPQRLAIGHYTYEANYLGSDGTCQRVALTSLQFHRIENYRVCGQAVSQAPGVSPAYPDQPDARYARRQVVHTAYFDGHAHVQWQRYDLRAFVVGPARADGCAQILTRITYQGLLVSDSVRTICHAGERK